MFSYDFIPQFATGKNKIVKFKSSKRNKQNGGELDVAQFGMEKTDTYNPYEGKAAAQQQENINLMNQYQTHMAQNKSNLYSGIGQALQQNFMTNNPNAVRSAFNKQQQANLNRYAPKYVMDSNTGAVTIQEPTFQTDPTQYSNGGYINHQNMYYAQVGMEVPRQEDFPDYNSYAAALQEWEATGQYMQQPSMFADSIPVAQPVIGVAPAAQAAAQAPAYALNPYQGTSVYEFLAAQNKAPDYASRKGLAAQLGIKNYRGTAAQNLQMMNMLKQTPDVLQSYSPYSGGVAQTNTTTTVIDNQGNAVQVPVDSTAKDTTGVAKTIPVLPKKKPNESEDKYVSKALLALSTAAAAGGLTYLESQAILKSINAGDFNLSGAAKAKLTRAINGLRNTSAKAATEGVKGVSEWFSLLPKRQQKLLDALDIAEIPGGLAGTRPGTAAKTLDTWKMLQEARAEGTFLNDAEAANAISEADAEAKALRSFNAQKAAAARWGKPMPKFPKLGAAPAVAEEASGFMNTLREASALAKETPWIRNTARFIKRMPKFQVGGEPDSTVENVAEWLDPTGITSWDDVYRSWGNDDWWETALTIAGAIPVIGKLGKGAKAAKALSTAGKGAKEAKALGTMGKAWNGTRKVVGTGLDWVGGSAPQRFIDMRVNPLTRGVGHMTAKAIDNSPKPFQYFARGIQPFQQGQRFWKGVGDVTGQGFATARVPQPTNEQVNIMMPNGQIVPMSTQDPELMNLVNQGMIDTAQFTGYEPNTNSWRAKKGIKYKGKTYAKGGSTFSGNAWYRDGGTNNPGFNALPNFVQHQILSNMAYGGIQIDPAKRGTFKAQATRMGMGVQQAASAILNAPEGKYSPAMRKKANFAKNFAKQEGGQILDVTPEEMEMLRQQGYKFEII